MRTFLLITCVLTVSCGSDAARMEEFNTIPVKLPDGATIRAEVMVKPADQARGMMFRETLAENRGMLFVNENEDKRPYWMYQVKFPLDLIWMNKNKRVVEVVAGAPPCTTKASECPNYGGSAASQYVLEMGSGQAARHRVTVGSVIEF